jgi:hypothetical protein
MLSHDGVFNHFKPTLGEALPHHCNHAAPAPLPQLTGVLLTGGDFVIGAFHKGLHVILLLQYICGNCKKTACCIFGRLHFSVLDELCSEL